MIFSNGDTPETEPESQPHEGAGLVIRIERVPWELIGYGLIFLAALAMRLWDLDGRAYHYDETIHAFDSWSLANGDGYLHSPWSHGPFLYHLSAVAIFIFGDNLASPRLPTVLFGAALVVMPWFLRHRLGMWGALAAAAMLAFSPSLFYFSRFIRNDVLTLVFDLALVISMWRFLETRRNVWLFVAAAALALGFSSKETTFISLGIVGLFLIAWWLADIPSVAHCLRRVGLAPRARLLDRRPRPLAADPDGEPAEADGLAEEAVDVDPATDGPPDTRTKPKPARNRPPASQAPTSMVTPQNPRRLAKLAKRGTPRTARLRRASSSSSSPSRCPSSPPFPASSWTRSGSSLLL